jgi:tryptophanyl-tRNA synthetase
MESFERELVPLRAKRAELDAQPGLVKQALADGAEKARRIARETMDDVRRRMGLGGQSGE